jgi:hypothetical protein
VLKHISSHKGSTARLSGLREAYFGTLLQQLNQTVASAQEGASEDGADHLVRFVESFQVDCTMRKSLNSITFHLEGLPQNPTNEEWRVRQMSR